MKKLLLILLIIPALSFGERVWIQGSLDCGLWLDARKNNSSEILEGVVLPFANGYAHGSGQDVWLKPTKISPSQLNYMVDQKCRNDPTLSVWAALAIILSERGFGEK
jgi:hypothetical protein